MEFKARVICEYESDAVSASIASAIQPDNLDSPEGVQVETQKSGRKVISTVEVKGEIGTLIATLDDLLACTSTAEGII